MMEPSKTDNGSDDLHGMHSSMISSTSPYQPTTERVPDRRPFAGGFILDMQYIKSLPGILKIVEVIINIIVAICVGAVAICVGGSCSAVAYLQFVCITAMVVTTILLVVHGFSLDKKIDIINWPLTDLLNSIISCILYIIGSICMAAKASTNAGKAASAFGFLAVILYGLSSWKAYTIFIVSWRKRHSPVSHLQPGNNETEELA